MSIIKEVVKRLQCTLVKQYADTNGYQGCDYYLLERDGKYSLTAHAYGTCELCDSYLALTQEWLNNHPEHQSWDVPLEAYESMILFMMEQATDCGWCTKDELSAKLHMHIGMGYSDVAIEDEIRKDLTNGS